MNPIRFAPPAGVLAVALVACQPMPPPDPTVAAAQSGRWAAGAAEPFRERRGWTVDVVAAAAAGRAYCRGWRGEARLDIVFIGGDPDSGFRLTGVPESLTPGASEVLLARFDHGERRKFDARVLPGPVLEVVFPTIEYDPILLPFARARSVTFEGQRLGPIGRLDLDGSSWAVNATDECRRMNAPG